jgi:hypothetical protein
VKEKLILNITLTSVIILDNVTIKMFCLKEHLILIPPRERNWLEERFIPLPVQNVKKKKKLLHALTKLHKLEVEKVC